MGLSFYQWAELLCLLIIALRLFAAEGWAMLTLSQRVTAARDVIVEVLIVCHVVLAVFKLIELMGAGLGFALVAAVQSLAE